METKSATRTTEFYAVAVLNVLGVVVAYTNVLHVSDERLVTGLAALNAVYIVGRGIAKRLVPAGVIESKPGVATTEFWVATLASVLGAVVAFTDTLHISDARLATLVAGLGAAYTLSRSIAKGGIPADLLVDVGPDQAAPAAEFVGNPEEQGEGA